MGKKVVIGKLDGWENVFTGRGKLGVDKKMSTRFSSSELLPNNTLTYLYTGEGIAKRLIDIPVEDMVREWFNVEGDTDNLILQRLDELHAKQTIASALRWGSLYGGSVIVIGIKDGGDLSDEVNEENIDKIEFLRVYDRWYASIKNRYEDPENPKFGEVEFYTISPKYGGASFDVHESRVLRFEGSDAPYEVRLMLDGWGMSDLQPVWSRLRGLCEGYDDIEHIISEFIIGVLTMNGLADLIAAGNEDLVKKRLNLIDLSKHIINTVLLDEEEKFERVHSTVSGLDDLVTKIETAFSSAIGIPVTRFFGQSPKGLQATGESDIRQYYDSIGFRQEERLQAQLEQLTKLIMLEKEGPFKGKELDSWTIKFNSLWQPTEKEDSETRLNTARTDDLYINNGTLTPEEVAESRFGGETYSRDTTISGDRNIVDNMQNGGEEDKDNEENLEG